MLLRVIQTVKKEFSRRPLLANCVIYGSLYAGAEFCQQTLIRKVLVEKKTEYDFPLIARYGVLGSTVFPAFLYYWYKFLDARMVGTGARMIVAKVIVDQVVTSPPILAVFYIGMSIMERKPDIMEECKEKFWGSFQKSCLFWMPAQAVNFLLMPTSMRVVYIGTCSFLWVNILCILKRQPVDDGKETAALTEA